MSNELAKEVAAAQHALAQAAYDVGTALQNTANTLVACSEALRVAMTRERTATNAYIAALEREVSRQHMLT